ncbi:cytochrome b [Endozoicomonas arenosclerae]|uniref:cytochrome b n=1 Tax=Endozoicomonas arenosclerae TaxID=1633495 RepID=UPI000782500C|nr:cytochrome b/b6 domain-containing protein [Endozoicomonas arenosclerae]
MNNRYSPGARFLHWSSAAVIIWANASGFYVAFLSESLASKQWVAFINVSLTTLFIPLFLFRCFHSLHYKKPESEDLNRWNQWLASQMHRMLYIITSLVLISGVLMMERDINVFNLFSLPYVIENRDVTGLMNQVHKYSCMLLSLMVLMHVSAVIKHELTGKRILRRMV